MATQAEYVVIPDVIGGDNWRVSDHRRRQLATTLPDRTTPVCRITKLTTRGMML